ncbi:MAG: glycerophosphodiester phosphodiesterase [Chloroflexota bacterium]
MDWQKFRDLREELARPLVMAHRGASALLAENTLAAFQRALDDGANVLETDLRFSKDDELVLIHDETLERTLDSEGLVRDYTLAEIQQCTVRGAGEEESAPTLRQLIEMTGGQTPLALELKDPLFTDPVYGQKLVNILHDYNLVDTCFLVSFDLERLLAVQKLEPQLAAGWITMSNLSPNHPVEFLGPFWPVLLANPFYVRRARKLGKIICPLDPAPEKRVGLYIKWGLDAIMTDNPAKTISAINSKL